MEVPKKRRKISVSVPQQPIPFVWDSPFNKEGKVTVSSTELGDGATSRVYLGEMNGKKVAVKKLKAYSSQYAPALINAYENSFHLQHPKVVKTLGLCPNTGLIILELCEKMLGGQTLHTLVDMMSAFGNENLPLDLRITVLADVIEGISYLHSKGVVHGDLKPLNVLVSEGESDEFIFKVADYACTIVNPTQTSHSTTLKQLMTPGYMAPELLVGQSTSTGLLERPSKSSDIYSFAILAYEVVFQCQAWPNVNIGLMENVRKGHRPLIPANTDKWLSNIIRECWLHDPEVRPTAVEVSRILEEYLTQSEDDGLTYTATDDLYSTPESYLSEPVVKLSPSLNSSQTLELGSPHEPPKSSHNSGQHAFLSESTNPIFSQHEALPLSVVTPESSQQLHISHGCSTSMQQSLHTPPQVNALYSRVEDVKSKLKLTQYKQFQLQAIEALQLGKDVIVVQPTGAGKSVCYIVPALLNAGKLTLVIEPVVAVITDQVNSLSFKGIDAIALGRAAGKHKVANFRRVFTSRDDVPQIAFCTPEYLFGTPASGNYLPTIGQFGALKDQQDILNLVVIDEVHKIFDRMPSFRPAFDGLKQLQQLSCQLLVMSATLTNEQIKILQTEYLREDNCITITQGVYRDNLKLHLKRYKRKKTQVIYKTDSSSDEDSESEDFADSVDGYRTASLSMQTNSHNMSWASTVYRILPLTEGNCTVLYVDFVRDVEQVVDHFCNSGTKAAKYTGQMTIDDRNNTERRFSQGEFPVLVATESFELGVNNPNITQVIRIGSPHNLGVLLQEFGHAGRKLGVSANAVLYFNECIDDKHLGVWLKSSLDPRTTDDAHNAIKTEILATYTKTGQFVYSVYHGKCLLWSLSYFYGGVDDKNPPTCFAVNAPLCMVCNAADYICEETVDIQNHLCVLLTAVSKLHENGLSSVTKTLLVGTLMKATSNYLMNNEVISELIDKQDSCWGSGIVINGINMTSYVWSKVVYVAVHLSLLHLSFVFRPFDNHYEVHRRYSLSEEGKKFLFHPIAVMSINPHSYIIDRALDDTKDFTEQKNVQNRGVQIKPRIMKILEEKLWEQGDPDRLKYLGHDIHDSNEICMYFSDCQALPIATKDPHYLLHHLQLSRTQATTKELKIKIDGEDVVFLCNRSYCAGVKVCAGEGCDYTVSNKQRINRCKDHPKMALSSTGSCGCHLAYIYPKEPEKDGRRWFVALNVESTSEIHNHLPPSEWKISPKVLSDIANLISHNSQLTPKDIQKGVGIGYRPMEKSMAAANIDRMRAVVNKTKKKIDKVDTERVNPFKIISSFPAIKDKIDQNCSREGLSLQTQMVNELVGTYQLDADDAYTFTRDRRFAYFQSPFQAYHWSKAVALFVDIDHTGNHHFPYLLNIVCFSSITDHYLACGRALLNHQDGISIGKALSVLTTNVKRHFPSYDIKKDHKEIMLDFDDAEANAFRLAFGEEMTNVIRGCSVHFIRSAMRVAKLVNISSTSLGYQIFMSVVKLIPDNSSKDVVNLAFKVLSGAAPFTRLSVYLPPPLNAISTEEVDTTQWKNLQTWTDWWTREQVLKKLSKAFSDISEEYWDVLPSSNNPVESINRQSVPDNAKSVSLRPLLEHIYLEDRRQAAIEVAAKKGITISYAVKERKRTRRSAKVPEKKAILGIPEIPVGRKVIGLRISVEFFDDDSRSTTTWFKGTVIAYSRKGYVVTFDGCGPEENETIKSLKDSLQKGEIKLI